MPQHGALQQNEMKRGKLIDTYVYDKPKNSATFHQCGTAPFVHLLTVETKKLPDLTRKWPFVQLE